MMEFIARVKAVLRDDRKEEKRELHCGELSVLVGRHEVQWKDRKIELTRKEFELLQYLFGKQRPCYEPQSDFMPCLGI